MSVAAKVVEFWLYRRSQTAANERIVHQPDCGETEDELQVKLLNRTRSIGLTRLKIYYQGCRRRCMKCRMPAIYGAF